MTKALHNAIVMELSNDAAVLTAVKTRVLYLLAPMTDKARRLLALDIVDGRVYGSWMLPDEKRDLMSTFMVLLFADRLPENIGGIYEYYADAGPMSVNGRPIFYSCRFFSTEDTAPLNEYIKVLTEQRKSFAENTNDSEP